MEENSIIKKVKEIVHRYDSNAETILFGSRARGDWDDESDWDFLVLSDLPERSEEIKEKARRDIFEEIEMVSFNTIQVLWHNKKFWEDEYAVTGIYESIKEEGVAV